MNEAGLKLLKDFEGCRLKVYADLGGVLTIGYGHTGDDVKPNAVWSQKKADAVLEQDIAKFESGVLNMCAVDPNDNQLAAMTCLAFNIGLGAFKKSTVLRLHNAGNFTGAANAFTMWNRVKGEVKAGLTRRRAAEAALYLTPIDAVEQTTRATPDAAKDPSTASVVNPTNVATTVGGAAVAVQQTVANFAPVWDTIQDAGIDPRYLMALGGIAALGVLAWFIYERYQRHKEGDR